MKNTFCSVRLLYLASLVFCLTSCPNNQIKSKSSTTDTDNSFVQGSSFDLKPLVEYFKDEEVTGNNKKPNPDRFNPAVIPTDREDLTDLKTVVKFQSGRDAAGVAVPGFGGITLKRDESNLNVYYVEAKTVIRSNDTIVYGVGYSVHYLFRKIQKGLNAQKLTAVAASVELNSNRTQVFYSLQTYGITGTKLVRYFKPVVNEDFDVKGFGIIQASLDGMHIALGDTLVSEASQLQFTPRQLRFLSYKDL